MNYEEVRKRIWSALPYAFAFTGSAMGLFAWWIDYKSNPIELGTFLLAIAACMILQNMDENGDGQ